MARQSSRALWTQKLKGGALPKGTEVLSFKKKAFEGVIVGIDPSLRATGLAVISFSKSQPSYVFSKTICNKKTLSFYECLGRIAKEVADVVDVYAPLTVALEQTIYVQNFQTAQILGAARGAAIAPIAQRGIPIKEYPPLKIKQAVLGYGKASKEQISKTLQQMLTLKEPLPLDESDAAATAICHAFS